MLYTLKNAASHAVMVQEPWAFVPTVPPQILANATTYKSWWKLPTTEHCLFSGFCGASETVRVTNENPPAKCVALVADYDTPISQQDVARILADPVGTYRPNWVSKTIPRDGARLIWLFEKPALLGSSELAAKFLQVAIKGVAAIKQLAGLDEQAALNWRQYYDVGHNWQQLSTIRIPATVTTTWLFDAGNDVRWSGGFDDIPIAEVEKLVAERFPNRWPGAFQIGSGGVRFWDPTADNPRGCIVRATGMQCFTGPVGFMPWASIFGNAAVERYRQEAIGGAVEGTYYDGKWYWSKTADKSWKEWSREDVKLMFKIKHGISTSAKNGSASAMDRVLHYIHDQRRVVAALPFVHFPDGPINIDGATYLNISTVRPISPAPGGECVWGSGFDWLASFLDHFFAGEDQKVHFLNWLQRFYKGAVCQKPEAGQAVMISGATGVGKTLLANRIIGQLMGGNADASNYLMGDDRFSSHILSLPVMTVNDTSPATDSLKQIRYSAMLKKIVANQNHTYEKKFQSAGMVKWIGRIVVTSNLDAHSIQLIPNLDISISEKVNLYRCHETHRPVFPPTHQLERMIADELPFFGRWLMNWEPQAAGSSARFGEAEYHDRELYQQAMQNGPAYVFSEALRMFLQDYHRSNPTVATWEGSISNLYAAMSADEGLRSLVSRLTVGQAAVFLGQLAARGYPFKKQHTRMGNKWVLPIAFTDPDVGPGVTEDLIEDRGEADEKAG